VRTAARSSSQARALAMGGLALARSARARSRSFSRAAIQAAQPRARSTVRAWGATSASVKGSAGATGQSSGQRWRKPESSMTSR
jgi:hypothetical protein